MAASKRAKLEEGLSPEEESEPKLKCHEMRLIFQRLPTSELIRFISNQPKHALGKFWSQELTFVVEQRLPFSMEAATTSSGTSSDRVIYDCNGGRVAEIKCPQQFHLSPICDFIESANVPAISLNASSLPPQFVFPIPDILSTLTNLDTLVLWVPSVTRGNLRDPVDLPAALNPYVMSRIKSLTLSDPYGQLKKPLLEIISRATSLKKLSVTYVDLNLLAALPSDLPGQYSSLESLTVKRCFDVRTSQPLLEIITTRFSGLRELFLPIRASVRQYLAAFQALPSLTTFGLDARGVGRAEAEKQFAVDESDASVVSVTELFIACRSFTGKAARALLGMLPKFPNVRTFGADCSLHVTDFGSAVCAGGVFRHLQSLKLFSDGDEGSASLPSDALLQFVRANIDHLPSSVDLSQVLTARPTKLDREFLVDLCAVLQGGRVISLALKDLIHRDAVPRLRENFALTKQNKSTPQAKVGKILAWIGEGSIDDRRYRSRAARWPEAVSDFTDFRIEAYKASGPLKGSLFKVRISDWSEEEERERLFDVWLD